MINTSDPAYVYAMQTILDAQAAVQTAKDNVLAQEQQLVVSARGRCVYRDIFFRQFRGAIQTKAAFDAITVLLQGTGCLVERAELFHALAALRPVGVLV